MNAARHAAPAGRCGGSGFASQGPACQRTGQSTRSAKTWSCAQVSTRPLVSAVTIYGHNFLMSGRGETVGSAHMSLNERVVGLRGKLFP